MFCKYEDYGEEFVNMLDGMFSFVLLDTRDQSFIAARDAFGIIPSTSGGGLTVCFLLESFAQVQLLYHEVYPLFTFNNSCFNFHANTSHGYNKARRVLFEGSLKALDSLCSLRSL